MEIFIGIFLIKIEGDFSFLANLFFLARLILKGISFVKMKAVLFFGQNWEKSILKESLLKGTFFHREVKWSEVKKKSEKVIHFWSFNLFFFQICWFLLKGTFFHRERNRVLSHPRYRPPTPVLMEVKVKVKSESEVKWKWIHFWSFIFFQF